jgi:hypothetical protein
MPNQDELSFYTRRIGESARAFEAYCAYRDLGAARSLAGVSQKLVKSRQILSRWSARWDWVSRCAAYDADLAAKEKAAKDYALEAESKKWAEREVAMRETFWQMSELLKKKAEQILQFPLQTVERKTSTETTDDGRTIINHITIIKPSNFAQRDAAIIAKVALDMAQGLYPSGAGRKPEPGAGEAGMTVGEDIEVIRRKRWIDAAPALLALMEAKQAKLKGGEDENSAEPKAS